MEIKKIIRPIGTPLTIFTSLVVFASGLFMYFKVKNHLLEEIHSQIGILFLIGTILHLIINWTPFTNYFFKKKTYFLLIPILIISAFLFINENSNKKGDNISPGLVFNRLENASYKTVKEVFKPNQQVLMERLSHEGITIKSENLTINEIAEANKIDARKLISAIAKSE